MVPGKRLIVAGAAALLVGLVVGFPASLAYQQFAPPGLALSGLSGTIWKGQAAQGSAWGLYLENLSWQFHPLSLITLEPGYRIAAAPIAGFLECDVAATLGGVRISNLAAAIPIASLQSLLPVNGVEGDLSLQFDKLVLDQGFPVAADGTLAVAGLTIPALSATALGDFRAFLRSTNNQVTGDVEDVSGVLDVTGEITLLPDRSYRLVGRIAAEPEAPEALQQQLRFLGSPDDQGRREFRLEGQL
ncbi:MAG: type II secretion system protein N [Woeseia sp.]